MDIMAAQRQGRMALLGWIIVSCYISMCKFRISQ